MLSGLEFGGVSQRVMARFQAHGVVVLVDDDGFIRNVSHGCDDLFGCSAESLVGLRLPELLPGVPPADLVMDEQTSMGPEWQIAALSDGAEVKVRPFAAAPGLIGLDVVPVPATWSPNEAATVERIMRWTDRVQSSATRFELLKTACSVAVSLSEFEGVWAIHIGEDRDGFVEATCVSGGAPDTTGSAVGAAYLPPGDPIVAGRPAPFFVADVAAAANELVPMTSVQIDVAGSALHRPYDEYLDFLASFGVRSAYSIPVSADGRTWARVIGHHPSPKVLNAAVQTELRLLGIAVGVRLQEILDQEVTEQRLALANASTAAMRGIAAAGTLAEGLKANPAALLELCDAGSAIIAIEEQRTLVGAPLPDSVVAAALKDARVKFSATDRTVVSTATMPFADDEYAGGYLAMRLDEAAADLVVWVRPEQRRTVQWVSVEETGSTPETERRIVDAVTNVGRNESSSSKPWTTAQIEAVETFRGDLASVTMARFGALQRANAELERSNSEFNAFAHTVAHDLRAPLRGVMQYTEFFLEDVGERLSPAELDQLNTVLRLAGRGVGLLKDLMRYAQLGETIWTAQDVDLATAAAEAVELLDSREVETANITIETGTVSADPSALRQLLLNLIGNAIKYSEGTAQVRIGMTSLTDAVARSSPPTTLQDLPSSTPVLFVTDQGVGLAEEYFEAVFALFTRANRTQPDATGTGAGLAMCRRIAQRHGGDIWLTSAPGAGTTIYTVLHP